MRNRKQEQIYDTKKMRTRWEQESKIKSSKKRWDTKVRSDKIKKEKDKIRQDKKKDEKMKARSDKIKYDR